MSELEKAERTMQAYRDVEKYVRLFVDEMAYLIKTMQEPTPSRDYLISIRENAVRNLCAAIYASSTD